MRVIEHEGLCQREPGLGHEAVPRWRRLIATGAFLELVRSLNVPAVVHALRDHRRRGLVPNCDPRLTKRATRNSGQPTGEFVRNDRRLVGILRQQHVMGGLCRRTDRMRGANATGMGVALVDRRDRVERIVHRQVHHRERSLPFERQELILGEGDVMREVVPGHDHVRTQANESRAMRSQCRVGEVRRVPCLRRIRGRRQSDGYKNPQHAEMTTHRSSISSTSVSRCQFDTSTSLRSALDRYQPRASGLFA